MKKWLSEDFVLTLEQLSFLSKKLFYGGMKGDRLSKKQGTSVEFADYRRYQPGDDIRYIDWSLYARLDKLLVKLFHEETNIYIYVLIDRSCSMDFGFPSKLDYGLKVAAALSYIGVSNMEQVGISTFSSQIDQRTLPYRGKTQMMNIFEFLSDITPGGHTDLNKSLEMFAVATTKPGIVIIISDFWDEKGYETGLKYLLQKRFEVSLIQLLSPEELTPQQIGPLTIKNVERKEQLTLNVNRGILKKYQKLINNYNQRLAKFCQTYNIVYVQTLTDIPFEELVLRYMKIRGS
jgi:uncharacterized protein (DUF58 family)